MTRATLHAALEQRVLDLHGAGFSVAQICAATGLDEDFVRLAILDWWAGRGRRPAAGRCEGGAARWAF